MVNRPPHPPQPSISSDTLNKQQIDIDIDINILPTQPSRLPDLLDQLSLTVQCLDHSVPIASPDDPLYSALSRATSLLEADPTSQPAWSDLEASLEALFDPQSGPLNVKRGVYGVESVLSFVQRASEHPAAANRISLLEALVDRVLRSVVERCTQPQAAAHDQELVPMEVSGSFSSNFQPPIDHTGSQDGLTALNPDQSGSQTHHSPSNELLVSSPNQLNGPMAELQNGGSQAGSVNNRKRQSTTVAHKLEVIEFHNNRGATQKETATQFGLTQSQLSRWLKEEADLREYVLDNGTTSKRQRTGEFPQLEDSLLRFFLEAKARNIAPSDDTLKERTKAFMKLYDVSDTALKVSNGWLLRFKGRNNVKSFVRPTSPFESYTDIDALREKLRRATDSFALQDIYVAGEAGLFCNLAPLIGSLDVDPTERLRLTYLLCTNADGTDKRVPLVVGRSQERAALTRAPKAPPFWYRFQTRGWLAGPIFAEWVRKFDRDMQRQGRRVMLVIEAMEGRVYDPDTLMCTSVLLVPRGMASQVMPLRAGIVQTFKSTYRRSLMEAYFRDGEEESGEPADQQRRAMECGQAAWEQVTSQTIVNCFAHTAIVSARLGDGLTVAAEHPARGTHPGQFASDLDMEQSLMATQSAMIQLEREMGVREASQIPIEQVVELEGEESQAGWECMPTDEELVAESKFHAAQQQEEIKERKKAEQKEPAKPRGSRPKRKCRQRKQPQTAAWAPSETFEFLPMSVQQIINGLDQIEYSIQFYLDRKTAEGHEDALKKMKNDLKAALTGPNVLD